MSRMRAFSKGWGSSLQPPRDDVTMAIEEAAEQERGMQTEKDIFVLPKKPYPG